MPLWPVLMFYLVVLYFRSRIASFTFTDQCHRLGQNGEISIQSNDQERWTSSNHHWDSEWNQSDQTLRMGAKFHQKNQSNTSRRNGTAENFPIPGSDTVLCMDGGAIDGR